MKTNVEEKTQIKEAINRYCTVNSLSKNQLAVQLNVSSATLSKIQGNNWESINSQMWIRIKNHVCKAEAQKVYATRDFASIVKICEAARQNSFMIGLTADTGMGKTTGLTHYSQRKSTFYVSYDKTMKPRQFFVCLLREMGIAFEGNLNEMVNRIADELNTIDKPLIIIDEAGKITHSMILYLHVLKDKTSGSCGYVLAGMPYFKANLIRLSNKQREGYAEFLRRINVWHQLIGLNRSEIEYVCSTNGINDAESVKKMHYKTRFGDLINEIILHKLTLNF
ncbi:MAG: ATP-binding protein [Daejeonella sp.]